jgi:hypothetical protein
MPREDDDLCLRLSKKFKFKFINEFLSFAIHNNDSKGITRNFRAQAIGYEKLFKKYYIDITKFCSKKSISDHYYLLAKKFYLAIDYNKSIKYSKSSIYYNFNLKNLLFFIYAQIKKLMSSKFHNF